MYSDKRIRDWRDAMRNAFFLNFERDKFISNVILTARIDDNGAVGMHAVNFEDIGRDKLRDMMSMLIARLKPDAYIAIGEGHVLLTDSVAEAEEKIRKHGSVSKVEGAVSIASFIYETKAFTNVEIYEIIRNGDEAVINKETLIDTPQSHGVFTGHLNMGYNVALLN